MKIIIPMSGSGSRFIRAGYQKPKPLIVVDGKPIIEHVLDMYPGNHDFTFICSTDHLRDTNLREVLVSLAPDANIIPIEPHKKGPVYALALTKDQIGDDEKVLVSYCDFGARWDFEDFQREVAGGKWDAAVPSYTGFHPHLLRKQVYGGALVDDKGQMRAYQEKYCFTKDPENSHHSAGNYYFRSGKDLKVAVEKMMSSGEDINGEYYVSQLFYQYLRDGKKVWVPEMKHFLQFGTPEDLEEYEVWSRHIKGDKKGHTDIPSDREGLLKISHKIDTSEYQKSLKYWKDYHSNVPTASYQSTNNMTAIIPMAGLGSRFSKEGYTLPKPLIPVSGEPMIIQVIRSLPECNKHIFIVRQEHIDEYSIDGVIKSELPNAIIIPVSETTDGQATTCMLAMDHVDDEEQIFIAACDNSFLYNKARFEQLQSDQTIDSILWTFTKSPLLTQKPEAWGWIKLAEDGLTIDDMSVKVSVSDNPFEDHAVVATFYFKRAADFKAAYNLMREENYRINNEFYVDSLPIFLKKQGKRSVIFDVDLYVGWGKPADLYDYQKWEFECRRLPEPVQPTKEYKKWKQFFDQR